MNCGETMGRDTPAEILQTRKRTNKKHLLKKGQASLQDNRYSSFAGHCYHCAFLHSWRFSHVAPMDLPPGLRQAKLAEHLNLLCMVEAKLRHDGLLHSATKCYLVQPRSICLCRAVD